MRQVVQHALGGAALAFSLFFAPVSGAMAGQSIDITSDRNENVCGNSDNGDCSYPHLFTTDDAPDGNTVIIRGGVTVNGTVDGKNCTECTSANDNRVISSGAVKGSVSGGYAGCTGTDGMPSKGCTANGNFVSIEGGEADGASGGSAHIASDNTVSISGGHITGNLFGGSGDIVQNNTVEIKGNPIIESWVELFGGVPWDSRDGTSTGNTLKLSLPSLSVSNIHYFQNINFYVPANKKSNARMAGRSGAGALPEAFDICSIVPEYCLGDAMLTLVSDIDLTGVNIYVEFPGNYQPGDQIYLINVSQGRKLTGTPTITGSGYSLVGSELANGRLMIQVTGASGGGGGVTPPSGGGSTPVTPVVSGDNAKLNLACLFQAPQNVQGSLKSIYLAAALPDFSAIFFLTGSGDWQPSTQSGWPVWRTEPMSASPYSIPVSNGLDVRGLPTGTMILVGWGNNPTDVMNSGQYSTCYTIKN
ncbi:MAG: hypothetical protein FWD77_02630 [Betaproteobacteria bacterium]|nr:hypothetical protein [Betaproteobacteria bacterium]